jgi:endoribonuclease LACTB2
MENILTLTVNSTHFFLIDCQGGKLLIDAGWELGQFTNQLKVYKLPISEIRWVMFTHHHPDHAGLVQSVKDRSGARMFIHPGQVPFLDALSTYFAKKGGYEPIRVEPNDLVSADPDALRAIGVRGTIVETPGHSPDSISLVLDSGAAFIGDLPAPDFIDPEQAPVVRASWEKLLARGAQHIYHSHIDPFPAQRIRAALEK